MEIAEGNFKVNYGAVGDPAQVPMGYSTLSIVRLCGLVVEIVDNEG